MLLPITVKVEATASMIFFGGIYYGAMYGGSTTSILLNTPGEAGSMVTAMEGNKMAKSGALVRRWPQRRLARSWRAPLRRCWSPSSRPWWLNTPCAWARLNISC